MCEKNAELPMFEIHHRFKERGRERVCFNSVWFSQKRKNYREKKYGYGYGHPIKKTGFIKVDNRPF